MHRGILVVDDDPAMRSLLVFRLETAGYSVTPSASGEQALELLEKEFDFDLVLLDNMLTGISGLEVLKHIKQEHAQCQVIMLTGYPSVKIGVEAIKSGAYDFICKPFDMEQLLQIIKNSLEHLGLKRENETLRGLLKNPRGFSDLVGQSDSMNLVRSRIRLAADSLANVLITGESGTGKEIVAHTIHQNSKLGRGPFVVVNCGAIPTTLFESELFGHEKGAFTHAFNQTKGKFEQAQHGSLFLDEISELPMDSQVKLLRVIQEKEVVRLGGSEAIRLHIRIIAATNQSLPECIERGYFREDLYYRIALFLINLPGLNERGDDVILLAHHFLEKYAAMENREPVGLDTSAENLLRRRKWTGHVRELENCLYRTMLHYPEKKVLGAEEILFLPAKIEKCQRFFRESIRPFEEIEADILREALQMTGGNVSATAHQLKMARGTLYRKIRENKIVL